MTCNRPTPIKMLSQRHLDFTAEQARRIIADKPLVEPEDRRLAGVLEHIKCLARAGESRMEFFEPMSPTLQRQLSNRGFVYESIPHTCGTEYAVSWEETRDTPADREQEEPVRDRLTRNAARCLVCDQVVESKHVHDFVTCPCGNLSVDGGLEYSRVLANDMKKVQDLCERTLP